MTDGDGFSPDETVRAKTDPNGRLTIKKDDREALGIDGERCLLKLGVEVLERGVDREGGGD